MKEAIPLNWRKIPERYLLVGSACNTCGSRFFPIRQICPNCRRKGSIRKFRFSGKGKIVSYTKVFVPPEGFEAQVPYILGIIELDEGARVMAQVVDAESVEIGQEVEMVFRVIQKDDPSGLIHYGFKFKPVRHA